MSTNTVIKSMITKKGVSKSEMYKAFDNANSVAAKKDVKKENKKKK